MKTEVGGVPVVLEQRPGDVRRWTSPGGRSGATVMGCGYGYLAGTRGADGDGVDVMVGPDRSDLVHVVRQMRPPDFTEYDEDKVMAGFDSADAAKRTYLDHYDDPRFFGSMATMSGDELARRLKSGTLRADSAEPLRVAVARRFGVDLSVVSASDVARRYARLVSRR